MVTIKSSHICTFVGQPVTHASHQSAAKFASQQSPVTVTRQQAKSSIGGE